MCTSHATEVFRTSKNIVVIAKGGLTEKEEVATARCDNNINEFLSKSGCLSSSYWLPLDVYGS